MRKITLGILASMMLLAACKKEDSKDYFSCKINGVDFYMDNTDSNGLVSGTSAIGFGGYTQPGDGQYLTLEVTNIGLNEMKLIVEYGYTGKGSYSLTDGLNRCWYSTRSGSQWNVDNDDSLSSGTLTITSQTDNIIEGTFAFDAVCADNCDSSIHVTEGKFKMPFKRP